MLILLSPAKKLLNYSKPYSGMVSEPSFVDKTKILVKLMQSKSAEEIAGLMDLSKDLAALNFQRYQDFLMDKEAVSRSYPAVFLFQGDVYQGLQANTWDETTIAYAQEHLRILSGLYGLLNPLDMIQPYRLEMGVHLQNPSGKNLYDFWQETIVHSLNHELAAQKNPFILNLASTEYFKAVDEKKLNYPVLTVNFYERKNEQLKMVGIHAKKARGVMAKFLLQQKIDEMEPIKAFNELGYKFHAITSTAHHFDFVRDSKA